MIVATSRLALSHNYKTQVYDLNGCFVSLVSVWVRVGFPIFPHISLFTFVSVAVSHLYTCEFLYLKHMGNEKDMSSGGALVSVCVQDARQRWGDEQEFSFLCFGQHAFGIYSHINMFDT